MFFYHLSIMYVHSAIIESSCRYLSLRVRQILHNLSMDIVGILSKDIPLSNFVYVIVSVLACCLLSAGPLRLPLFLAAKHISATFILYFYISSTKLIPFQLNQLCHPHHHTATILLLYFTATILYSQRATPSHTNDSYKWLGTIVAAQLSKCLLVYPVIPASLPLGSYPLALLLDLIQSSTLVSTQRPAFYITACLFSSLLCSSRCWYRRETRQVRHRCTYSTVSGHRCWAGKVVA